MKALLFVLCGMFSITAFSQTESDSVKLEKLRRESGVDPTRVQSRVGYTFLIYDQKGSAGQVNNQLSTNIGVGRWAFSAKYAVISRVTGEAGTGFTSGMGDIRFSTLNAFYVKGKNALAGSAELSMPTGKAGFGSQYFSLTPALTYSYTIKPSLVFAIQPQYSFHLMKDPLYPSLSVVTIRTFLAKFTQKGYFFVFEPRPIFDLTNDTFDLILSPIIGKALGGGFNFIVLCEFPTNETTIENRGNLYQFGFNKNF